MNTLFFILSKLVWGALNPGTWLVIGLALVILGLWRGWLRLARGAALVTLCFVVLVSVVPIGQILLRPLETRYPVGPDMPAPTGIIVLGGGEHIARSAFWKRPELNNAAERFTATMALARQYPDARVIFTGGSGALGDLGNTVSGATVARAFFAEQGLDPDRLTLEGASRNTAENATRSFDLIQPEPSQRWVLITSAFHMPRAMNSFTRAGWTGITPWPVDFRSAAIRFRLTWSFVEHLPVLNTALREYLGLLAYRVTGR
ncbi:YdcF family protein [Roseibaca sp. V10]|uniref:YdcF family protein n=1 Tax=Roseinatronobacter domitianus TaxID=2940293 RepID=A0ABT0M523_9RHOB|nr:YdcF family protein [Roseibaca domitiana]MCL1629958.1 YdcF family protein [Roseibaca domitiana]